MSATFAIYDEKDWPVVIGNILFCSEQSGMSTTQIYNMVARTKKPKQSKAKFDTYHAYVIDRNDEKLDTYLMDRKRWSYGIAQSI